MIIEETTTYAYKLKYIENVSFNRIRAFAQNFVNELPQELVDNNYEQLNRGLDLLQNEPQMLVYLYSFGNMHQAKLNRAFEQLPDAFLQQPEIRIVDYGCGQAIGTMCYADFLADRGVSQTIKSVTLIEPSEICLKRAALHVSQFFPNAEIRTVCKTFNNLTDDDLAYSEDIPTLHILSNVLDIQEFDLEDFANLIANNLSNYNQFVCVGPYFNYSDKDVRMTEFAEYFNGNVTYSKIFDKGELCSEKTWTAQIVCFSNGELEEKLSTEVNAESLVWGDKDKFGVFYSGNGKRLLQGNSKLTTYSIKKGTRVICNDAFNSFESLQQITIPDSVTSIGNSTFAHCESLQQINIPDTVTSIGDGAFTGCINLNLNSNSYRFTVTDKLLIDNIENRLISYFGTDKCLIIPNSITSIGNGAFAHCESLQQIIIPDSVLSIGDYAFCSCYYLQQITIPNCVTFIGNSVFAHCESLQQITIPDSVTSIGNSTFAHCESLQQITIPDSVTSIGKLAFTHCESLQQITIPDSVASIGWLAFEHCIFQQIIISEGTTEKFKRLLPKELWRKLYYLKKAE